MFLQYVLGFSLALMVWRDLAFKRFFRVLFLIPMMTTPVIMTVIWKTVFHESLGPVNDFLSLFEITPLWLSDETLAKGHSNHCRDLAMDTLHVPAASCRVAVTARGGIPCGLHRRGRPVRKFIYVTFPLMAPISIGAIIIRLIEASKIMDTIYVLTSGGPGTATETSSFYIFIKGLREFQMGYSAALSFTYLVIMIVSLTIIAKVLVRVMIKKD